MSKTTRKLEELVLAALANRAAAGDAPGARQRAEYDRLFSGILTLIAPRIRHFIRQYGLADHWDDAEQVCAIAVHTALASYDPEKAKFTTHINWQLRGELQGLRFRLMADQRPSARKVAASTISLSTLVGGDSGDGSTTIEDTLEDEGALDMAEAGASAYLARSATAALIDAYIAEDRAAAMKQLKKRARPCKALVREQRPDLPVGFRAGNAFLDPREIERLEERLERDRLIVVRTLFEQDSQYQISSDTGLTRERIRQISRRAARGMAGLSQRDPRFQLVAEGPVAGHA